MLQRGAVENAMTGLPDWIEPGAVATLIWYDGVEARPDGVRVYQVAGPVLELAPPSPFFLLAPVEQEEFAGRLYRGEVGVPELRRFLGQCRLAEGRMSEALDFVFARAETPPLSVLDGWRALPERPLLVYQGDLDAFLGDGPPVYVCPKRMRRPNRARRALPRRGCARAAARRRTPACSSGRSRETGGCVSACSSRTRVGAGPATCTPSTSR